MSIDDVKVGDILFEPGTEIEGTFITPQLYIVLAVDQRGNRVDVFGKSVDAHMPYNCQHIGVQNLSKVGESNIAVALVAEYVAYASKIPGYDLFG